MRRRLPSRASGGNCCWPWRCSCRRRAGKDCSPGCWRITRTGISISAAVAGRYPHSPSSWPGNHGRSRGIAGLQLLQLIRACSIPMTILKRLAGACSAGRATPRLGGSCCWRWSEHCRARGRTRGCSWWWACRRRGKAIGSSTIVPLPTTPVACISMQHCRGACTVRQSWRWLRAMVCRSRQSGCRLRSSRHWHAMPCAGSIIKCRGRVSRRWRLRSSHLAGPRGLSRLSK
ncbi:hypothetical protein N430_04042 [Pseudomonas sp. CC120222-01a]|nr:hypothetical protein N430_04042 [Pseudomonas sp. CC120222-01a]